MNGSDEFVQKIMDSPTRTQLTFVYHDKDLGEQVYVNVLVTHKYYFDPLVRGSISLDDVEVVK